MKAVNPGATTAAIDQERAAIRELLDALPHELDQMIREPASQRALHFAMADCLTYRSTPDRMLAHLWAWWTYVGGEL